MIHSQITAIRVRHWKRPREGRWCVAVIHLLPDLGERRPPANAAARFCSHCAAREHDFESVESLIRRVCPECGLGILLRASPELLGDSTMLVVVTADLRLAAATRDTEELLGYPELLFGRPLLEIPVVEQLARPIAIAALGADGVSEHSVQIGPRSLTARVGRCGDPVAALAALDS